MGNTYIMRVARFYSRYAKTKADNPLGQMGVSIFFSSAESAPTRMVNLILKAVFPYLNDGENSFEELVVGIVSVTASPWVARSTWKNKITNV